MNGSDFFWSVFFLGILWFVRWALVSSERRCKDIKKHLEEIFGKRR